MNRENIVDLHKLLEKLDNNKEVLKFKVGEFIEYETAIFMGTASVELQKLVTDISVLCEILLVDENSQPNTVNVDMLRTLGFPVIANQTDHSGWLSGTVILKNFRFIFGT